MIYDKLKTLELRLSDLEFRKWPDSLLTWNKREQDLWERNSDGSFKNSYVLWKYKDFNGDYVEEMYCAESVRAAQSVHIPPKVNEHVIYEDIKKPIDSFFIRNKKDLNLLEKDPFISNRVKMMPSKNGKRINPNTIKQYYLNENGDINEI